MALPMYDAILKISRQPKDRYTEQMQELINAQWDNTITVQEVYEESAIGSFSFNKIEARISHMVAAGTTTLKQGDDFKKITYKDIDHEVMRGRYY